MDILDVIDRILRRVDLSYSGVVGSRRFVGRRRINVSHIGGLEGGQGVKEAIRDRLARVDLVTNFESVDCGGIAVLC